MADLSSTDAVTRESAIARLAVIGPRAIDRLGRLIQSRTTAPVRAAALRALEAIDDPRAFDTALTTIDDTNSSVSIAAIAIARRYLRGAGGAGAVDRLTRVAIDQGRPEAVRLAALRALGDLDRRTMAPLLTSLAGDPIAAVREEAAAQRSRRRGRMGNPGDMLTKGAEQGLPGDPVPLHRAVVTAGDD